MLRPIEANLSLFNVDHMANQVKDPNATHAQGAQQIDVKKDSEQMSQSVHAPEETDGVRISDKERERRKREEKKKKQKNNGTGEEELAAGKLDRTPGTSMGFSFIA